MSNSRRSDAPLTPVERALKESLHSPTFLDVKFFAFSRRSYGEDGAVRVSKPQHVLAISTVLKKIDYFDKRMSQSDTTRANLEHHPDFTCFSALEWIRRV